MKQKESPETSLWISTTDLMSGLLVVFLFVAVLMNEESAKKQEFIDEVTGQRQQTYAMLDKKFDDYFTPEEREAYNLDDPGDIGHASFAHGEGRFLQGSEKITPEFARVLDDFLPKYIKAIRDCESQHIQEIRIEGHTSSEWHHDVSPDQAYIYNMQLSQSRTREIIKYALNMSCFTEDDRRFIKEKLTANGLSSSHLIKYTDGNENAEASRRIEFRVVTDDAALIDRIARERNL